MSTASKSIKENKLPAHSVSIEIYSGVAQFPSDNTTLIPWNYFPTSWMYDHNPPTSQTDRHAVTNDI